MHHNFTIYNRCEKLFQHIAFCTLNLSVDRYLMVNYFAGTNSENGQIIKLIFINEFRWLRFRMHEELESSLLMINLIFPPFPRNLIRS